MAVSKAITALDVVEMLTLKNKGYAPPVKRFWGSVDKSNRCWNWLGRLDSDGYGHFNYKDTGIRAHKLSYLIRKGDIPAGLCVLHTCDNPRCVRPAHLFLGTPTDNMNDRDKKQRQARGNRHGMAKLTPALVRFIRKNYRKGVRGRGSLVIGRKLNVTSATVLGVMNGRVWKHV